MYKQKLAITGIIAFIASICLFVIPRWPLYIGHFDNWFPKLIVDHSPYEWVHGPFGACSNQISVETTHEYQIMAENDSQAINTLIMNNSTIPCECAVELSAVGFSFAPNNAERVVGLAPGEKTRVRWAITPTKIGSFALFVDVRSRPSVSDKGEEFKYVNIDRSDMIKIRVTSILGLSAWQTQLITWLGAVLGSALTLPYWYEKWQARKKKRTRKRRRPPNKRIQRRPRSNFFIVL